MIADLKVAAYYLGQFHPTVENDEFWGPGFTEWHNVAKARPLYPGHQQPKLPGKFGFYDLRCFDTLGDQIAYSHGIGVDAFCHWHYWFAGRRVLHRPMDAMLELKHPGYKFMLAWANESWSGVWHGAPHRVLIEQGYNPAELKDHARLICGYLDSGCYLMVGGRAPFVIYRPKLIPNAVEYLSELKRLVYQAVGMELYLVGNWAPTRTGSFRKPSEYGLDAAVVTPLPTYRRSIIARVAYAGFRRAIRGLGLGPEILRYSSVMETLQRSVREIDGISHATVVTGWDNTPRSGRRGLVVAGYNESNLRSAAADALELEGRNENPLLFIKSWNEWAEGNVIEPVYLERWSPAEVVRDALQCSRGKPAPGRAAREAMNVG